MEKTNYNIIRITNTLRVVSECWVTAEENLQADIKNNYPEADEEFITKLFHGKFNETLKLASESHSIAQAFLIDLNIAFPLLQGAPELRKVAQGLVANVTLHKRQTERLTGGDLGFQIMRPQIKYGNVRNLLKVSDYRRGILCQAKLRKGNGKWGAFTKRQKEILPEKLYYLSLLLYSFEDDERRIFQRFRWQLCKSASFEDVVNWLRRDTFPSIVNSADIIHGIGNGHIGTDDIKILDEVISPRKNPSIIINITWPDGSHPGSEVRIHSSQEIEQKVNIHITHLL